MTRRTWTLVIGALIAVGIGVLGATVQLPFVALGPGPTFNTLGVVDGKNVVTINGLPTYPTSGHLNMTTVAVADKLTMFRALALWAAGDRQLVPREAVYKPGKTEEQVDQENAQMFTTSETNAEVAALSYLKLPMEVVVGELSPGSPSAGVLAPGDRLIAANGKPVQSVDALHDSLADTKPGQQITVTYQRGDGQPQQATVTLGSRADAPQGLLGVTPSPRPIGGDIMISLGDIGGPSAGLMFSLAVVDKLTPGDLTGGRFVAGTGEITQTGEVRPIGGIPLKMIAAKDAGASAFLVPDKNCQEASANAPDGLQLVKVSTLADAVTALDSLREGRPAPSC